MLKFRLSVIARRVFLFRLVRDFVGSVTFLLPWDFLDRKVTPGMKLPKRILNDKLFFAENSSTPSWILKALCFETGAGLSDSYFLTVLAGNPSLPVESLDFLSLNVNSHVRAAVASNVFTSVKVLAKLSDDSKQIVLDSVVKNVNLPEEFKVLAGLKSLASS